MKILVATGEPYQNGKMVEIIDLFNPNLTFDSFMDERLARCRSVGGLLQNQLFICGGYNGRRDLQKVDFR